MSLDPAAPEASDALIAAGRDACDAMKSLIAHREAFLESSEELANRSLVVAGKSVSLATSLGALGMMLLPAAAVAAAPAAILATGIGLGVVGAGSSVAATVHDSSIDARCLKSMPVFFKKDAELLERFLTVYQNFQRQVEIQQATLSDCDATGSRPLDVDLCAAKIGTDFGCIVANLGAASAAADVAQVATRVTICKALGFTVSALGTGLAVKDLWDAVSKQGSWAEIRKQVNASIEEVRILHDNLSNFLNLVGMLTTASPLPQGGTNPERLLALALMQDVEPQDMFELAEVLRVDSRTYRICSAFPGSYGERGGYTYSEPSGWVRFSRDIPNLEEYDDWCVAYHGTRRNDGTIDGPGTRGVQMRLLVQGLQRPPSGLGAHQGKVPSKTGEGIYVSPSVEYAAQSSNFIRTMLEEPHWVQMVFECRVRPGAFDAVPSPLSRRWDEHRVRHDSDFPNELEWLVEDEANVIITGILLREFGPTVDPRIYGEMATQVRDDFQGKWGSGPFFHFMRLRHEEFLGLRTPEHHEELSALTTSNKALMPCAATRIWSEDNLLQVDIPAGAAPESAVCNITIRLVTDGLLLQQLRDGLPGDVCSAIYALEPHGQRFEKAVTIRMRAAELAEPQACCASHAGTRAAGSRAHSTAMLKRSFDGTDWTLLSAWVDGDGKVAASMQTFCFIVLSCCKPLVSVAERVVGGRVHILVSLRTALLGSAEREQQERNEYRWTDTDMTRWKRVFSHGETYKLQALVGTELLPHIEMAWDHWRGFEQFPISANLQSLRGAGGVLHLMCDDVEQMQLELVSAAALPSQLDAGSATPENQTVEEASEAPPTQPIEPLGAVVVGNQSYPNDALTGAVPDATRMYDTLRGLGFEDRCALLQNVGADVLKACCAEFVARLGQQLSDPEHGETGVALFYFAGHGVEVDGKYQMVPVPTLGTDGRPVAGTDNVSVEDTLLKPLEKLKVAPGRKALCVLVFDTCRTVTPGGASSSSSVAPPAERSSPPGKPQLSQRLKDKVRQVTGTCSVDYVVVWACTPGGVAKEGPAKKGPGYVGGQLTKALVDHLGRDDSIWSILQRVGDVVRQSTGDTQRPCASVTLGEAWSFRPTDLRAGGVAYEAPAWWRHFENQVRKRIEGLQPPQAGATAVEAAVASAAAASGWQQCELQQQPQTAPQPPG